MPTRLFVCLVVDCFSFRAGIVLQPLEDLSCHAVCMSRSKGEWCIPHPAAQDLLQPLLSDLKLRQRLSSKQLAAIKRLYTDLPVRIQV